MKKWFSQLGKNFKRTSSNIKKSIFSSKLDNASLEDIEEAFLLSDFLKDEKILSKQSSNL